MVCSDGCSIVDTIANAYFLHPCFMDESTNSAAPQTAKNPKSLRSVLTATPTVAEVVSVKDLPEMGGDDFMVVLVKLNDEFYADTVIVEGEKLQPGTQAEFTADEAGSFPKAKGVNA